jgi:hypothetical protein
MAVTSETKVVLGSVDIAAIVIVIITSITIIILSIICSFDVFRLTLTRAKHEEKDHQAEYNPLEEGLRAKWLRDWLV